VTLSTGGVAALADTPALPPGATTTTSPTTGSPPTVPAATIPATTVTTAAPPSTTPPGQTRIIPVSPAQGATRIVTDPPAGSGAGATTTTRPGSPANAPSLSNGQVDQMLRTMERSGASSTTALVEALKPLQALGMTAEEALALGMGRFPVQGIANWTDDWLDFRAGPPVHQHMGNDLFAAFDTPVRAPADGTVRFANEGLGGLAAYVTTSDGTYYYLAHLKSFALASGVTVRQGQVLGYNGDTGNAAGGAPHVHFEIHPGGGAAVNPKPIIDGWVADALARVPALIASLQPAAKSGAADDGAVPQILVDTGLTRRFSSPTRAVVAAPTDDPSRAGALGPPAPPTSVPPPPIAD